MGFLAAGAPETQPPHAYAANAVNPLTTPTPNETGYVIHADVYYNAAGWNGYKWWMAMTPYPDSAEENPCILVSNDKETWIVPPGGSNPIDPTPASKHNADTDLLVYDGTMYCYYNQNSTYADIEIMVRSSTDGINWSAETKIMDLPDSEAACFLHDGSQFRMYYFDVTTTPYSLKVRYSSSPTSGFGSPTTCTITQPVTNQNFTHQDIVFSNGLYHMVCKSNTDNKIYYAASEDGLDWYFARLPMMQPTGATWQANALYRPSIVKMTGDTWDLFYGARNTSTPSNNIGLTTMTVQPGWSE
jgi:predicted GH43/DUF377 family glycosyl hydrolase